MMSLWSEFLLNFPNFEEIVIIIIYVERGQWDYDLATKPPGKWLELIAIWECPLWEEPKRKCLLVAATTMRTGFGAPYPRSCLPLYPSSRTAHSAHPQGSQSWKCLTSQGSQPLPLLTFSYLIFSCQFAVLIPSFWEETPQTNAGSLFNF